ncbi:tetratricopeptide repeat protein [Micromonospora sp. NPDC048830]|uniref:tetratricopeptide repeat protein n=1 Tax=Micromonospora sp. NPDC048830 TaxID=3364257 RepID=UPI00371B0C34
MNIASGAPIHQNVTAVAGTAYGVIGADLHVFGDGTPLYLLEEHRPPEALDRAWLRELPSRMLNARTGVVTFTGRDRERDELRTWRESEPRLAVRWLHAPGGQGKTRLADHVAAHATANGWKAVMAVPDVGTAGPLPGSQDLRLDGHRGVLLIVDYADRWPLSALIWLLRNSLLHQPGKPARVMLLARGTAAWPALRATLEDHRVRASTSEQYLDPLAADNNDGGRSAMFTAARDAFAAIYQIPDPAFVAPPISLDRPEFGLTLTVHVAALVAVDAHATGNQPATDPDQLTRYLLDREREHWARLYESHTRGLDHHTPDSVMARTVFTAALTGPLAHPEATTLLRRVEQELPAERILTDHSRCYPPTDRDRATVLEPLYPDRLAEDFIAHTLPGPNHPAEPWAPTRLDELLQPPPPSSKRRWWQRDPSALLAGPVYLARVITFLAAAAARWPHVGPVHLYPLLLARPRLALNTGAAAVTALTAIPTIDIAVLEAIEALLPKDGHRHVDLDIAACAITDRLTPIRLATNSDPAEHAHLHALHAVRLANAGRQEEALAPAQEAVTIHRRLAEANPDTHLPRLAGSLNNLANYLSELGRREEALAPAQEAVTIHRRLAEANPDTHLPRLAMSLDTLGNVLSKLGRRREAATSAEEAVTIYWELIEAGSASHGPDVARSLSNFGSRLSELGQWEQALPLAEVATHLYRRLAKDDPATYLPELGMSLSNLGLILSELGRQKKALAPTEEAVTIRRRLAKSNPDAHLPDLAASLNNLGLLLSRLRRDEKALAMTEEAVTIRRRLAESNPDAHLPVLARSLSNLGPRLAILGRHQEALSSAEEAIGLFRRLAEAYPAAHLPELTQSLHAYVLISILTGAKLTKALTAIHQAISLYQLAEQQSKAPSEDLWSKYHTLADDLDRSGRPGEAAALRQQLRRIGQQRRR